MPGAAGPRGKPCDRRIGVIWHTHGSGKSLTMALYARRVVREPTMGNPTLVVVTDRNDLDARRTPVRFRYALILFISASYIGFSDACAG